MEALTPDRKLAEPAPLKRPTHTDFSCGIGLSFYERFQYPSSPVAPALNNIQEVDILPYKRKTTDCEHVVHGNPSAKNMRGKRRKTAPIPFKVPDDVGTDMWG